MKLIRVAAAAVNQTPLDWLGNLDNILTAIETARSQQASVLCLPELCISGYGCEDAFHSPGVLATALEMLERILPRTMGMAVSVGLPVMYAGGVFNTAAMLVNGRIAGMVAKQHLAGDGIHYEPRWFKAWPEKVHGNLKLLNQTIPIGDLGFDIGGIRFGFEICEDAWVGTRPGSSLASRGIDVILNPSASHFAFDKHLVRQRFVLEGSRAFHVSYVYTNLMGNESGRAIFDGDVMIASAGSLLAKGPRLSFEPVRVTSATIDIDGTRMSRARTSSFEPDVDGDESDLLSVEFDWPEVRPAREPPLWEGWERTGEPRFEEFTRAVALALYDYMRKSHSRGFVVSLSGGVDSAAAAVLVWCMWRMGSAELGEERFLKRGGLESPAQPGPAGSPAGGEKSGASSEGIMRRLLTTAYQATRNSSQTTRQAAAAVAAAVGCRHFELDIDHLVAGYQQMVSGAIGRELDWKTDDITLQNIQARSRAPGIWMFANLENALLLSTSNRSEAAVGYATMDGDTAGGLSPLTGIDKAFLRRWLNWMETTGPAGLEPIPALASVNRQSPTAELRPASEGQTDEADLMPYGILDRVERLAVRDKLMPGEVMQTLLAEYPAHTPVQLATWIVRFFRLWSRNQWKRERYAPSFHLDDANLDPKTWCRFPILSGGYEYELRPLLKIMGEETGAESDRGGARESQRPGTGPAGRSKGRSGRS